MPPGTFFVISGSRPDSVAEIFRDLHKRTTFAGGGVVAEISVLS